MSIDTNLGKVHVPPERGIRRHVAIERRVTVAHHRDKATNLAV